MTTLWLEIAGEFLHSISLDTVVNVRVTSDFLICRGLVEHMERE
jgi:hypothetical protein